MIGILLFLMISVSVAYAAATGSTTAVSNAIVSCGGDAVSLAITLAGGMAVWGGIMKIAEKSGLTEKLTALLRPALKLIFRGLKKDSAALKAIAMNVSANLLGLGNAATPLGIEAMKRLEEEERPESEATPNMVKLAVINACSAELIPTTVAVMRAKAGSAAPMEILPCVLAVSFASLVVALVAAELGFMGKKR